MIFLWGGKGGVGPLFSVAQLLSRVRYPLTVVNTAWFGGQELCNCATPFPHIRYCMVVVE